MLLWTCFPNGSIFAKFFCQFFPCPLDLWCAQFTYWADVTCAGQRFCHAYYGWLYGICRFCTQMSPLHSTIIWYEMALTYMVFCLCSLQCTGESGRWCFVFFSSWGTIYFCWDSVTYVVQLPFWPSSTFSNMYFSGSLGTSWQRDGAYYSWAYCLTFDWMSALLWSGSFCLN